MTGKPSIVVLDGGSLNPGDNPWTELQELGNLKVHSGTDPDEVMERASRADIILTNKCQLSAETINALPQLKFIGVLATGYNIVDCGAAAKRGIPVSNVPVYGTNAVSQYVFALLLELCHHVGLHSDSVMKGEWAERNEWSYWKTPLHELYGKTMVVVGYGRIGRQVGNIAQAFGMKVVAVDEYAAAKASDETVNFADLETAARLADVMSLNCALTSENAGMLHMGILSLMKPAAMVINAARGQLVVERDLAVALNEGRLAGAALDVVSTEPVHADNPLLGAKNCIITPHIAWATLEARTRLMHTAAENVRKFLMGSPQNVVNESPS
ncbi:MAG: D-2-hydroxyacid dehydrogenase [Spirochaetes bacterium]|nr:D-2-hydroxyacid dehydrogenase [Spirochaetota bacterium]